MGFIEKQSFRSSKFLWIILILPISAGLGTVAYGVYKQIFLGIPWGNQQLSDATAIIVAAFVFLTLGGIMVIFLSATLITKIDEKGIRYRYFPFVPKEQFIPRSEILNFEVKTYNPAGEFGGWGYRTSVNGETKAINVRGNKGLFLSLSSGKKFLIGTKKPHQVADAMKELISKTSS